jgi:hypothetical protein
MREVFLLHWNPQKPWLDLLKRFVAIQIFGPDGLPLQKVDPDHIVNFLLLYQLGKACILGADDAEMLEDLLVNTLQIPLHCLVGRYL